jgi:hypothetical protein
MGGAFLAHQTEPAARSVAAKSLVDPENRTAG